MENSENTIGEKDFYLKSSIFPEQMFQKLKNPIKFFNFVSEYDTSIPNEVIYQDLRLRKQIENMRDGSLQFHHYREKSELFKTTNSVLYLFLLSQKSLSNLEIIEMFNYVKKKKNY